MTRAEQQEYFDKGFTKDQVEEIKKGLEAGLDIEPYEDKDFYAWQMRQIRYGIIAGLPVNIYARKDFDWFQMEEIRLGLEDKLNVRLYAYPKVPFTTMRQLRLALKDGINLSKYLTLPAGTLKQLRLAIKAGVDLAPYIEDRYDEEQLEQIRICLEKKINIKPFISNELRGSSIEQIRKGLETHLDVRKYASLQYEWRQMREIRRGMKHQVNVSVYLNPLFDWQQMREIRMGLEDGLDVSKYANLMYPATDMSVKRAYLAAGIMEEDIFAQLTDGHPMAFNNFEIKITPDQMTAYFQVTGRRAGITRSVIRNALEDRGIVKGINEENINKILTDQAGNQPIIIAEGQKSTAGPDGYYEFFFKTEINRQPKVLEDGSLDYKDIEWFEQVKKGQKLAVYHPAEQGPVGYNIFGAEFPTVKGKELTVLTGKGFYIEQDQVTYVSNVDGIVELDGNKMEVSNLLTLGDVTAYMGDTKFDGNVHVTGSVGTGSTIVCKDDLIVDEFVEGAVLEAGGNIILRKGVNAQNKGHIRAGGNIEGSFFENANVKAEGNIKVSYCLKSNVECEGTLEVAGSKGSLIGGVTFAGECIKVNEVGNEANVKTFLKVGVSNEVIRRQILITNEIKKIDKELESLNTAYSELESLYTPEMRENIDMFKKIATARMERIETKRVLNEELKEVDEKIEESKKARIEMHGAIYEGVVVEINGKRWVASGRNVGLAMMDDENGVQVLNI
ncbi:MAG: FapA family protein [Lachnospiraceae bacterium]|nr:FapA family protein [Lachnospiraceae bacterium]